MGCALKLKCCTGLIPNVFSQTKSHFGNADTSQVKAHASWEAKIRVIDV
jgi:hypothetical protein